MNWGDLMSDSEEPDGSPGNSAALAVIEPATGMPVPAMIAAAGERAALRFIDFFTAHIRNPNTRAAYGVAVRGFFSWLEMRGVTELGRDPHASRLGLCRIADVHLQRADGQAAPRGDPPAVRLADRRPGHRPESAAPVRRASPPIVDTSPADGGA